MSCFAFVVKEWAKSHKKSHIPSKLYRLLFATFSATPLQFLSWNCRHTILQEDRYLIVASGFTWKEEIWKWMVIGHVDSFVQSRTSKRVWLPLATKIAAWNFYFLFKFWQDCFVEVCTFLFSYFRTNFMNVSQAIPDDIKHFQQVEPEHYFDYTNWRLKICIWRLPVFVLRLFAWGLFVLCLFALCLFALCLLTRPLCVRPFRIIPISVMPFHVMPISIMPFRVIPFWVMAFRVIPICVMLLRVMPFCIKPICVMGFCPSTSVGCIPNLEHRISLLLFSFGLMHVQFG